MLEKQLHFNSYSPQIVDSPKILISIKHFSSYLHFMTEQLIIEIINQTFEMEKKTKRNGFDKLDRNITRIKHLLENEGIHFHDPTGEPYNENRMDCVATILDERDPMVITDTMKPIIYSENKTKIIQQALVIVNG